MGVFSFSSFDYGILIYVFCMVVSLLILGLIIYSHRANQVMSEPNLGLYDSVHKGAVFIVFGFFSVAIVAFVMFCYVIGSGAQMVIAEKEPEKLLQVDLYQAQYQTALKRLATQPAENTQPIRDNLSKIEAYRTSGGGLSVYEVKLIENDYNQFSNQYLSTLLEMKRSKGNLNGQ